MMRKWAQEHGKAVRQLTVRQKNTKHATGTLPLNMYQRELPIGQRIQSTSESHTAAQTTDIAENEIPSGEEREEQQIEKAGEQESEYDSASEEEEDQRDDQTAGEGPREVDDVAVNFLSKTIRTRSGRAITLSNRALSSY